MNRTLLTISLALLTLADGVPALCQSPAPPRTILAIGAHCGDMEITAGAVLALQRKKGDRVVLLHMTLGEGGNPKMSPQAYGEQKRREAIAAAGVIGAETIFAPYQDGQIPNDEAVRRYVADIIRQVQPTHIITHWEKSIHKDHSNTNAIVNDATLLASLDGVVTGHPAHRGLRGIYFAENWEDTPGFQPYLYVDVSSSIELWKECVTKYEFIRGGISSYPYLDYYEALSRVRGADARKRHAVAFDLSPMSKKRVLDALP